MNGPTQRHYLNVHCAGLMGDHVETTTVENYDVDKAVAFAARVRSSSGVRPYGFQFKTQRGAEVVNTSGWHYFGGEILTRTDIKIRRHQELQDERAIADALRRDAHREFEAYDNTLLQQTAEHMELDGIARVIINVFSSDLVTTPFRVVKPFNSGDVILPAWGKESTEETSA